MEYVLLENMSCCSCMNSGRCVRCSCVKVGKCCVECPSKIGRCQNLIRSNFGDITDSEESLQQSFGSNTTVSMNDTAESVEGVTEDGVSLPEFMECSPPNFKREMLILSHSSK